MPGSTVVRDNPRAPKTSYIASINVSVSISVPLVTQGCAKISTFGCHCEGKQSGSAEATGLITVSVMPDCLACPLRGLSPVNIRYNTTAVLGPFSHNVCCSFGEGDVLLTAIQNDLAVETQQLLQDYVDQQSDRQKMLTCGCAIACPNSTDPAARGTMSGTFTSTLTTVLHVADDPTNAQPLVVKSNSSTATAVFNGPLSVCGGDSDFYGNGDAVESAVTESLKTALSDRVAAEATSFNPPTIIQPFPSYPIFMEYHMRQFAFANRTNISAKAAAVMYAHERTGGVITYVDQDRSDPPEASIYPPETLWIASATKGGDDAPINAVRLSTTALTGLAQLANRLGYFAYGFRTQILDAKLLFNVSFEQPTFSVSERGTLDVLFPRGAMYGTCLNKNCTAQPDPNSKNKIHWTNLGNMLHLEFQNITGSTTVFAESGHGRLGEHQVNITLNISSFDFSHTTIDLFEPKIPLPGALLQSLLQDVVKEQTPEVNKLLQQNPIQLPQNFANLLDVPAIHVVQQPGCCTTFNHGYLEFDDYLIQDASRSSSASSSGAFASQRRRSLPAMSSKTELVRQQLEPDSDNATASEANDDNGLLLVMYGSSMSNNTGCRLGVHGDVSVTVRVHRNTSCTQFTDSLDQPLFYSTSFDPDLDETPRITVSTSPFCTECLICDHIVELFACIELDKVEMYHSIIVVPNAKVEWDAPTLSLTGPLGAREVRNTGTVALVAWESDTASGGTCGTGSVILPTAEVRILSLNVTAGACRPMPAASAGLNRSLFYSTLNDTTATRYEANLECISPGSAGTGCSTCLIPMISPYDAPVCKTVSFEAVRIYEGLLLVPGTALQIYPTPPPTQPPVSPTAPPPPTAPSRTNTDTATVAVGAAGGAVAFIFAVAAVYRRRARFKPGTRHGRAALSINSSAGNNERDTSGASRARAVATKVAAAIRGTGIWACEMIVSAAGVCWAFAKRLCGHAQVFSQRSVTYVRERVGVAVMALAPLPGIMYEMMHDYLECHEQPRRVILTASAMLLVNGLLSLTLFIVWSTHNPFELFTGTVFRQVGLTGDYLTADQVIENFLMWSRWGMWSMLVAALSSFALSAKLYFSGSFKYVLVCFWIACSTSTTGLLIPPFTFIFSDGFVLDPELNSTILDKNPSIVESIEGGIGTGFASVAFSWYCILFTLSLLGVAAGTFFSAIFFFVDNGLDIGGEKGEVLQLQYGRVTLVVWLAHIMAPLVQTLAVIILYQVTGSNGSFLCVWVL